MLIFGDTFGSTMVVRGALHRTGNIIVFLSPWEPENLVSRDGFVAERSKCPDKSKHTTSILC